MSDPTMAGPPGRAVGSPSVLGPRPVDWTTPFSRLAVSHLLSVSGEALLALAFAGSVFFDVDPSAGRDKVLLGLLLTIAPFALVGPFIGPIIDRVPGGHRAVVIVTMVVRAVVAALMVPAAAGESLALFPQAFVMLVLGKTYQVARAAVVPTTVGGDAELVEANSKLQLLSGLATVAAGLPGLVLLQAGPEWVLGLTAVVFAAAAIAAVRIRPPSPSLDPLAESAESLELERAELRSGAVVTAAGSMAALRGVVGFVTLLLAFELRGEAAAEPLVDRAVRATLHAYRTLRPGFEIPPVRGTPPSWYFGAVVAVSIVGALAGALAAPPLRRALAEERILQGSTVLVAASGLGSAVLDGLASYLLLAAGVAVGATAGKQAFDALVQRDAPDADRGRSFARFETRFQVAWVLGALIPTVVRVPVPLGSVVVGAVTAVATAVHTGGAGQLAEAVRAARHAPRGHRRSPPPPA